MKGIRFILEFENVDYTTISKDLKKDLTQFSEENGFEFGYYEDNSLYFEGELLKNTRTEVRSCYTSVKKQIRNILKYYDKNIKLLEKIAISFTRL